MSAEGNEVATLIQLKMLAKEISETVGMTRGGSAQYAYWKSADIKDENDATDVPMTVSSFGCNAPIRQDGNGFVFSLGGFYHFDYEATVSSDVRSYSGSGMNVRVTANLSVGGKSALSASKTVNTNTIENFKETVSGSGEVFVEAGQRIELGVNFSKRTGLNYADYYPILNSASLTIKLANAMQEVGAGGRFLVTGAEDGSLNPPDMVIGPVDGLRKVYVRMRLSYAGSGNYEYIHIEFPPTNGAFYRHVFSTEDGTCVVRSTFNVTSGIGARITFNRSGSVEYQDVSFVAEYDPTDKVASV